MTWCNARETIGNAKLNHNELKSNHYTYGPTTFGNAKSRSQN